MRLELSPPTRWHTRTAGHQRVAIFDGAALAWGPLVALPCDRAAWITRALAVDVPASARLVVDAAVTTATRTGWPLRLVGAEMMLDDQLVEARLGAFYSLLEYGAVALLRARSREALAAIRDEVLEVLATGAPNWGSAPVCVRQLVPTA